MAEEYGGNIIVEAVLNSENFEAGAAKLENRMKRAAQNVDKATKNVEKLEQELKSLNAVAESEKASRSTGTVTQATGDAIAQTTERLSAAQTQLERYAIDQREASDALREYNAQAGSASSALQTVSDRMEKFQKRVVGLAKRVFIFTMITKALRTMRSAIMGTISADTQMSNSLAQIKGNLITAFAPIYNFVLPAIRTLLNWIAKLTAAIATFVNSLFGKTAAQASESAKALYDQANATEAAGSAAEKAEKQLASFDTINKLSSDTSSGGAGSSGGGTAAPDFSGITDVQLPTVLQNALQTIGESLGKIFSALERIWNLPIVQKIVKAAFSVLLNAFINVLDGFADILDGIADILNGDFSSGLSKIFSGLKKLLDPFGLIEKAISTTIKYFRMMLTNISVILSTLEKILPEPFANLAKSVNQVVDGILQIFKGDFKSGITSVVKGIVNTIISSINVLISGLNLILTPLRSVIASAGNLFGKNWTTSNVKIPSIPMLAQGAVIPGGRAFLSVLGDQPAGQTNIETPLDTMIEAFRRAGGGKQTIIIKIGDTEFKRFVYDAYNSEASRLGKSYA